jgi:hypothetical protein
MLISLTFPSPVHPTALLILFLLRTFCVLLIFKNLFFCYNVSTLVLDKTLFFVLFVCCR